MNNQPKMIWRRIMAFIGIGALLYYTLLIKGAEPWVIGSFLYLVTMWVFNPDAFITLVDVWKDGKRDVSAPSDKD